MHFTEENPPKLTEKQAGWILRLVEAGVTVQSVTLHPYSGAATISSSWKRGGGETVAIVQQDGALYAPATQA